MPMNMRLTGQTRVLRVATIVLWLLAAVVAFHGATRFAVSADGPDIAPHKDYAPLAATLRPFIERDMAEKQIPGLSVALVDDQETVWAQGFGLADSQSKRPATAATVYRIGSVSKLFTDIAIMQLVERGELNLDAPVSEYLPDFRPRNPFGPPITLRGLMSHRSGLLREPPVGNYFDPSEPSLAATVRSLNETELVFAPQTHTKYSNAAIAVVGDVLEARNHQAFAKYLKHAVLDPMGMGHSSFEPDRGVVQDLATAKMWTYDGKTFVAPTFQLGMSPAGSMYSTVTDLGKFVSVLLARGRIQSSDLAGGKDFAETGHSTVAVHRSAGSGTLLQSKTLDQMWSPQFPNPGGRVFGLGFVVSDFEGHRMVGHGGAIYGFATSLALLPDDKVGVVVTATEDVANAVTDRIAAEALRLVLAQRSGKTASLPAPTSPVSRDAGRKIAGRYGEGDNAVDLTYLGGKLSMLPVAGGDQQELRQNGDEFLVDGILGYGKAVTPVPDGIQIGTTRLKRIRTEKPAEIPEKWKGLIGEYGWDHDILYVFEKEGRLTVLIEWVEFDPLTQESDDVFRFPGNGLYDGEKAIFTRDASGNATQVQVSGVVFKRRAIGGVSGGVFRIPPVANLDNLRKQAIGDHPPVENGNFRKPDLVELSTLDPAIKLDIRYATKNNFLSMPVYSQARAFLQRPAAEALLRAHQKLKTLGYGLLIHDAYRPWYVTKLFWDATPDDKRIFVADPSQGSRHNRGCAVDLSLYDLATGNPIEMVGVYDEMSERSYPGYPGGTSLQRWHRELLRRAMEDEGFDVYEVEWWHFDYRDWRVYPILNVAFERLLASRERNGEVPAGQKPGATWSLVRPDKSSSSRLETR
jgi:CubicO group peptidase (beta-lactamase class C family)/D-alanyl-D-alanine dipeptidase